MENWLQRTELLLGDSRLQKLQNAHILIVGTGGVGAYTAEMLCRAGIGELTIVDADVIGVSNINRQLIALNSTIGKPKVEVLAQRLLDINPKINLHIEKIYVIDDELGPILSTKYDYVVDAIDTLRPKINLIVKCLEKKLPIVSSMGAGGRMDPTMVEVTDISKSHHCPLAHMLRKKLHKLGIRKGLKVVFSPEPILEGSMILCDNEPNKKSIVGTISYMPASFGIACASVVVKYLTEL